MHHARKNYVDVCSASTTIQSGLRGMGARIKLHFKRQTKAAVIIQVLDAVFVPYVATTSV
jgi:myosin-5